MHKTSFLLPFFIANSMSSYPLHSLLKPLQDCSGLYNWPQGLEQMKIFLTDRIKLNLPGHCQIFNNL
jgi:hypothetical protein